MHVALYIDFLFFLSKLHYVLFIFSTFQVNKI